MKNSSNTDFTTKIGSVVLPNPVMTASGTSGQGAELSRYFDLSSLGAVVVKSLHVKPWSGNPSPRLHPTSAGMINSVGLQGPGVKEWLKTDLPLLEKTGARVVVSIWGQTIEEFAQAAELLTDASDTVIAVEVNASCPNVEDRTNLFAHSAAATSEVVKASLVSGRPCWAKLSSNTPYLPEIARAAKEAGAEAVTVANTLLGMAINADTRKPVLGAVRGGVSGPAIKPIALRSVFDTYAE
ncbi:MAG TPA: dihydroorotate dehydrogenase, partial [Acidimicrobiales bacterium]|nr:dihydroorotate dehydrogenase [Acidimicrobiales bacterium]